MMEGGIDDGTDGGDPGFAPDRHHAAMMPSPVPRRHPKPPPPRRLFYVHLPALLALCVTLAASARDTGQEARTVYFPSADGHTELTGYLFQPAGPGPYPALVMLHGRAGPYSSRVSAQCAYTGPGIGSPCQATSLSQRHLDWARYWSGRGYLTLLVDSFGPRGLAHGFGRHTHDLPERQAVNELTVRPLDAEGALAWLATRADVLPGRIMLQGWSNGGSTALNVMHRQALASAASANDSRPAFAAALAFYPGCGPRALLSSSLQIDRPLQVLLGSADEEASPRQCQRVLQQSRTAPDAVAPLVRLYPGATHGFDDPGRARQALAGNRVARRDVLERLGSWLDRIAFAP